MHLIRAPLAALTASFVTNYYWLGQERLREERLRAAAPVAAPLLQGEQEGFLAQGFSSAELCAVIADEPIATLAKQDAAPTALRSTEPDVEPRIAVLEREFLVPHSSSAALCEVVSKEPTPGAAEAALAPASQGGATCDAVYPEENGLPFDEQAGDPVVDAVKASWATLLLLRDLALFAAHGGMAQIWQWPSDNSTALPSFSGPLLDAESKTDLLGEVPTLLAGGLANAGARISDAGARAHERVASLLEEKLSPEHLAQLRTTRDSLRTIFDAIAADLQQVLEAVHAGMGAARQSVHAMVEGFLERHPEHRGIFVDRDPLAVLLVLAASTCCTLWEAWRCLSAACAALRCVMSFLSCGCCTRSVPSGAEATEDLHRVERRPSRRPSPRPDALGSEPRSERLVRKSSLSMGAAGRRSGELGSVAAASRGGA